MLTQSSNNSGSTIKPKTRSIVYSTKKALEDNILKKINEMVIYIHDIAEQTAPKLARKYSAEDNEDTDESEDEDNPEYSRAGCGEATKDLIVCVQRMPFQAGLDSDFMALGGMICQKVIPSSLSTLHKAAIYKMLAETTTSCLDLQMRLQDPEFDIVRLKYLILAFEKEETMIATVESVEMRGMLERMEKFKVEKGEGFVPEPNWGSLFSLHTSELVEKYGEHGMYVGFEGDFA